MSRLSRRFFGILAAALFAAIPALSQSGEFIIAQHGASIGTANFNFLATRDGYDSTSVVRIAMQGLDYALSKTEKLDSGNHLVHVLLSGTVNGSAVYATAKPDPAQYLLNISANGRSTTTRLEAHPAAVFLADFDPGALETLLALAVAQNNRDLWVIVPKGPGTIQPVELATYRDEEGTLDGKPVVVHHLVATYSGASTQIFSGPRNELLQAELPQAGFAIVRKGFVLTPPAHPAAPPAEPSDSATPPTSPNSQPN
jgi:hypothetical protein